MLEALRRGCKPRIQAVPYAISLLPYLHAQMHVRSFADRLAVAEVHRGVYLMPKPGQVVVDVGAGIGDYARACAVIGASVESYEPDASAFACLEMNTRGLSVVGHQTAVTSLHQLPACDLLKVDVEGEEFLIFDSAPQADTITLEWHAWAGNPAELAKRLAGYHYTCLIVPNPVWTCIGWLHASRKRDVSLRPSLCR